MDYMKAFIIGGIICLIAQIIMDNTKLVSGQILVLYITLGVVLTALGLYEPIVQYAGAGATTPLTGFGYCLVKGTIFAVKEQGLMGCFTGPLAASAGGITAAIVFGYFFAVIFKPKTKK